MDPRVARRTDRFAQFGVAAADQAAAEAGLSDCDPGRIAVILGTGVGGLITLQEQCESFLARGERGVSPNFVPMMMPNAAAGAVAIRLGLHGPGFSVASACATGAHAIGEGMRMIERGSADIVVAGGAEAAMTTLCIAAFRRMGALSTAGVSRPFDARRDGFVMGEGSRIRSASSPLTAPARRSTTASSRSRSASASARARRRSPRPSRRSATCSERPGQPRRWSASRRCDGASCRRRSTTRSPTLTATSTTSSTAPARRRTCDSRCRTPSASAARTPAWRSRRRSGRFSARACARERGRAGDRGSTS